MCGRYVSTAGPDELAAEFAVDDVVAGEPLPARWNVAPTQPIWVVATRRGPEARRQLGTMRWGLVPEWAEAPAVGARMINARAETVATKAAFRPSLLHRRCVIPADGFWEWRRGPGGRLPHAVRRHGGRPLALAGLWAAWRGPGGAAPLRTAAIVTTAANRALAPLHHRMPVVLDAAGVGTWLDPAVTDPGRLLPLLVPAGDDGWEAWPVGPGVNSVANDGPELLVRAEPPAGVPVPGRLFAADGPAATEPAGGAGGQRAGGRSRRKSTSPAK